MTDRMSHGQTMASMTFEHPEGPEYRRPFGFMQNSAVRREIRRLDPEQDCQRIAYLMVSYEFQTEIVSALDLAYFGSGATKSIADILGRTDFSLNGMKRYEDTRFLIWKFMESGWDKDQGARAIAHMNRIHGHYRIKDNDFGLALCVFIVAPLTWIDHFGWRKLLPVERKGWLNFWLNIGRLMSIETLPETEEEAAQWLEEHYNGQEELSKFSPDIGQVQFEVFEEKASWYKRPFIRWYLRSLMTPSLERAYDLKPLPLLSRLPVLLALKLDAFKRRWVAEGMYPYFIDRQMMKTYPEKTPVVEEAGPSYILEKMKSKASNS